MGYVLGRKKVTIPADRFRSKQAYPICDTPRHYVPLYIAVKCPAISDPMQTPNLEAMLSKAAAVLRCLM